MRISFNLPGALPIYSPALRPLTLHYDQQFDSEAMDAALEHVASRPRVRGIDRMTVDVLKRRFVQERGVIRDKCLDGTYRFAPYLEQIVPKGREEPRVVSIPTVRDRVVLHILKHFLHGTFHECVGRQLPNAVVRDIHGTLSSMPVERLTVFRTDIKSFYDSIDQNRLLDMLATRIHHPAACAVLRRAIRTPTVAGQSRRANRPIPIGVGEPERRGVPQGLAISNILANVALIEFDLAARKFGLATFRYVDDLLFIVERSQAGMIQALVKTALEQVGLSANMTKTECVPATEQFRYLGYQFCGKRVEVQPDKVDRLVHSLAVYFATWRHEMRDRRRPRWRTDEMLVERTLDEINERITGAISGKRRYGWLFHYLEISDPAVLYRLDGIVRRLAMRAPGFPAPDRIKSFVRAYHEALHSPRSGYIFDYARFESVVEQREILNTRGYVSPVTLRHMSDIEVQMEFARIKRRRLARLERDAGMFS